jgi:hypothetical protein
LHARLVALEKQTAPTEPTLIIIRGGLNDGDPTHGRVGETQLDRKPGEGFEAFKARVLAEAKASGVEIAVIGGLQE